jgi:mono/diheme cytochrome c family protein
VWALSLILFAGVAWTVRFLPSQAAAAPADPSFEQFAKPFLVKNCQGCHNVDNSTAGIRVDVLDARFGDEHVRVWEAIGHRIREGTMPPKGTPQPADADRRQMAEWIARGLDMARLRPAPKNGLVRRLTVSQYRNTLRDLLGIEDDLASVLPADAVSKDGFLNNRDTLQLSPLLMEAYFEIAEKALDRAIVDPASKPSIQNFRVDLGAGVNPSPLPEKLVLGAGSQLLENSDVLVTQLTPSKPFEFEPFFMRTKYRFIEGYRGNDTVRGWRDYDSIYHAVFADMRGSGGYPKGSAWSTVPEGLLLRPAIPTEEMFDEDGTYGPKANFKISLRELPEKGPFRVTVTAAKYNDGLLLDPGAAAQSAEGIVWNAEHAPKTVAIPQAGIYQVDVYATEDKPSAPDALRLKDGLAAAWPMTGTGELAGRLEGMAQYTESPVGKALSLTGEADALVIPRAAIPTDDAKHVGEGDFAIAAWIHPKELQRAAIASLVGQSRTSGWYLELPDERGILRFRTVGQAEQATGSVSSRPGAIRADAWQHVAAVVRRGRNETLLYVNGSLVAKGALGAAQFDDPKADLQIGNIFGSQPFRGEMADVRLYRRPLETAEILALVAPGKQLAQRPVEKQRPNRRQQQRELKLNLGDRQFSSGLRQPAFLVVRLEAGSLRISASYDDAKGLDRVVLTPLSPEQPVTKRFLTFEKRLPRVGVHLGLRRDCGSTFAPVGRPQTVKGEKLAKYVFEGTISNFPRPIVEDDNVNYLAGIHEIAVRSEYTDGRDMPRLVIRSVEFEGPYYEMWPPQSHRNIFVSFEHKNDTEAWARKIVRDFAARAFRHPVTSSEESSLMAVYAKARAGGRSFREAVKDTLQVILMSPQFLFLVETSASPGPEPLDNFELASKLSYFLWNGPPDRKTLQLASTGVLAKQLNPEVDRMIAHPRFGGFVHEFASQWLSLDKFQVLEADRKRFPKLTRDTRTELKREPVEFIHHLIRNNLPVKNLISSDFIVANEAVASYYDLGNKTESGFRFVAFPHGRPDLGGILTQPAIMAGLSDGRESNPVKRGAWLARKIIAEPPADPPPNVPALKEDEKGLTLRERLEQHRSQPACMQCHTKIDPWGVALEEYDAGGRRKQEAVDARSTLPDKTEVTGADDLKRYLGEDRIDQVAFSVLKHLATYASGRSLTYNELDYLKRDGLKLKAGGYRMKDMVRYVVNSKIFLEK